MEDKKLYKCKEYRITDPGDIIIGTEGNSSDDTVRLSGKFFFLTFELIFDDLDLGHDANKDVEDNLAVGR